MTNGAERSRLTYEDAKRLVLLSAAIMEREPEKHGYRDGDAVPYVEVLPEKRTSFCLMGGAAALLVAERGETYAVHRNGDVVGAWVAGEPFALAMDDILDAIRGKHGDGGPDDPVDALIDLHDRTASASAMARKVRAYFVAKDGDL